MPQRSPPTRTSAATFHGTTACLSALFAAGRYAELIEVVRSDTYGPYKRWAVKAMAAMGRADEAIAYAEGCRGPWASDTDIDRLCERIRLSLGRREEAYAHYGLSANRAGTYLAWLRAVRRTYPEQTAAAVLADLVRHTPGDEGKWFAAAKSAKLFDEAIALAHMAPCDPKTLTRAARDFAQVNPTFATEAGCAALRWLAAGHGYEITAMDVWAAYHQTLSAATNAGLREDTLDRIRACFDSPAARSGFAASVLGTALDLG